LVEIGRFEVSAPVKVGDRVKNLSVLSGFSDLHAEVSHLALDNGVGFELTGQRDRVNNLQLRATQSNH
jgi:hypothetical protein